MEKIIIKIDNDIKELIPDFIEARLKDSCGLPKLVAENEYERIVTIGHGMRGSGGGYGFDEITRIGGIIEDAARRKDGEKIIEMANNLKSYLGNVEIIFVN
jgi:hypothetical protein